MSEDTFSVLVVEDHPDVAEMMMVLLRLLGHRVAAAGSIAETIETVYREDFDLLLVDYRLPDGTGSELLKKLSPSIPAVLVTAFDEQSLDPSTKEGFATFLRKPVEVEKLRTVIDDLCGS